MKIHSFLIIAAAVAAALFFADRTEACTSAIVSGRASSNGRPFIWKHRDTGTDQNFVERVATPGCLTYVALFNGGDSLLRDAWMGMNEAGFMVMNTASYNLAPDTARIKDREGEVMRRALEVCRSIDDFRTLLDTLPRPMGVQANFGVLDANGAGGYFETNDIGYATFLLSDTVPYLVRTNFSVTGNDTDGMGYIRYDNACKLMGDGPFSVEMFTEGLSRSFYHSLLEHDMADSEAGRWIVDQDFIPRYSSAASIAMMGATSVSCTQCKVSPTMFATLGYPPVGQLYVVTLDNVPDMVRPVDAGYTAPACNAALERKAKAFPITRGSGKHYIDMDYVRGVNDSLKVLNTELIKNTLLR